MLRTLGYSLTEMLVALLLMSVGIAGANSMLSSFKKHEKEVSASVDSIQTLVLPVEKLRADARVAQTMTYICPDPVTKPDDSSLVFEFAQAGSGGTINRQQVIYTKTKDPVTGTYTLNRRQCSVPCPPPPSPIDGVNFTKIAGISWCIDNGATLTPPLPTCISGIARPSPGNSSKRLIAQFSYVTTVGTSATKTLQFAADVENIPFDCRTEASPAVMKESSP